MMIMRLSKQSKRIVSLLLMATMVLTMVPYASVSADEVAQLKIDTVSAMPGETVEITAVLENAVLVKSMAISEITYDTSKMTLTNAEWLCDAEIKNWNSTQGRGVLTFGENSDANGPIFKMTFKVNSVVADSSVSVSCKITLKTMDAEDNEVPVAVTVIPGAVEIVNEIRGDMDSNEKKNSNDAVYLLYHTLFGKEDYPIKQNGDLDGNGKVNSNDAVYLLYHVLFGEEEYPIEDPCSHTMEYTPCKLPTCTQPGDVEYYYCTTCGKYFNDSNGTTEINPFGVVPAEGHKEVTIPGKDPTYTEPGYTEGKKCSVCGEILVPQVVIPMLQSEEYVITYKLPAADSYLTQIGAEKYNTNPTTYKTDIGIEELEDLEVPGYDFFGWYTEPNGGGQRISSIPVGTTGKKTLYAHMTPHVYKITFDTPDVDVYGTKITGESVKNYAEYTVDAGVTLTNPSWYGYVFVGWSNDDGFIVDRIKPGTTGNMTLHANWTSKRNLATSYQSYGDPIIIEDADKGQLLFVYNIGKISNVPLNVIDSFDNMDTYVYEKEVVITDTVAEGFEDTINEMISNATTKSSSWTLAEEWEDMYTATEEVGRLSEKSDERTTSTGSTVGGKYFVSNSEGGSTHTSNESGGSTFNSSKVTTDKSFGINGSYDKSTEKYCDAQLGIKSHLGSSAELGAEAGITAPVPVGLATAGVNASVAVDSSVDSEAGIQNGRKDNSAFHIDGSYSQYTGTVDYKEKSTHYNSTISNASNWNSDVGFEESYSVSRNEQITTAIKEQLSQKSTHSIQKAVGGSNSETSAIEDTAMSAEEYSTTLTYNKGTATTTKESIKQTFTTPGFYRYITTGTVHVYGVVGYDVATASYFTYCFNVLDDETDTMWDYSHPGTTDKFQECENGVVAFEIPFEVSEYVAAMVGKTNGLEISDEGEVSSFVPTDEFEGTVVIPQYEKKTNADGSAHSAVKVTTLESDVFANVKEDIEVVVLPAYITEIPDNTFAGCTNLKAVIAYGVTKIGNNAFAGCTSLEKFYVDTAITYLGENAFEGVPEVAVTAYDSSVAEAAINCGAQRISLNISYIKDSFDNRNIEIPESAGYFFLIGNGGVYNNVSIKSYAEETMINNMVFANNTGTPIELMSSKVTFARISVIDSPGFAVMLKADNVNLNLLGNIKIGSIGGKAIIGRSVTLGKVDASTTSRLTLDGDYLICGSITDSGMLDFTKGEVVYLTEDEYEALLTSSVATFDPNGGAVDVQEKRVYYGQSYGDLPIPEYDYHTFLGWYTEKDGGTEVTSDTLVTSVGDHMLYAHWELNPVSDWVLASEVPEDAEILDHKWTYTETTNTESRETSLDGYTQTGSYWVQSGSGSANYASFPSGFDTGNSIYNSFMKSAYSNSETATTKRTVSNSWAGYVYWHWMYNVGTSTGFLDRAIYYQYGYAPAAAVGSTCANYKYQYFQAFTSGTAYSPEYSNWNQGHGQYLWYNCTGVNARSSYFYRFDYYTSYYTDYYKMFQYQKIEEKESGTEVTEGGSISNVQEWVQYRAK